VPHFSPLLREVGPAHLHNSRPAREKILFSEYPKIKSEYSLLEPYCHRRYSPPASRAFIIESARTPSNATVS
jgi:hypothetical protein